LSSSLSETYLYDAFNRLTLGVENAANLSATTCSTASGVLCLAYGYDPWGNRLITDRTNVSPLPGEPPAFDTTTNRISGSGFQYDTGGRGYLAATPGVGTFGYDAEGRQIAYCGSAQPCTRAAAAEQYYYDGEGRRAEKVGGSGTTTYVYDAAGQLASEYSTAAPAFSGRRYLTTDHLGTTRIITDASGNPAECHDYHPFGAEVTFSSGNSRYGLGCYATASLEEPGFTGKERDSETGLDYFGARYFSGAQGRFTSVDPVLMAPERLRDPQQLNLYVYARNNPLKYIDPTGTIIDDAACQANKTCASWEREYRKSKEGQAQWKKLDDNQNLTVTLKWDSKAKQSTTTDQNWDAQGNLVSATVTLAKATGDPSNHMNSESYPLGSAIIDTGERQVYVVAHELAHVEDAQTPEGRASMQEVQRLYPDADARYKAEGYAGYAKDTQLQKTFEIIRTDNKRNENVADKRAAGIVESYRACTQAKGGCQ
jgi:RHS repeat-associated protein